MKNNTAVPVLFFAGIIISSVILSPFILDFTLVPRFTALSVFFAAICFICYKTDMKLKLQLDPLLLFYTGYVAFCGLSVLWAQNLSESIFENCKLVLSLLTFLLTYFCLKQQQTLFLERILKFSIVLFLIVFTVGVYQFMGIRYSDKNAMYAVTGINGHKNLFSSFLFLNLFFLINAFLKLKKLWKLFSMMCIVLSVLAILFLKTKAVWIGITVAFATCCILYFYTLISKKRTIRINSYLLVVVFVVLANAFFIKLLPSIIHRAINYNKEVVENTKSKKDQIELDNERLVIWDKTYTIFNKNSLIGVGVGSWQIVYPDATLTGLWRCEDLNVTFQRPHNDFLWILSETGIIGFNLFLFFGIGTVLFLFKAARLTSANKPVNQEIILCAAFILGFFSISFFDFPRERMEHLVWIHIILGIAYYHIKHYTGLKALKEIPLDKTHSLSAAIVLLFMVSVGILRYKGEFYVREMYGFKNANLNLNVLSACKSAESFAYTIDPTSLPITWYSGNANASLGNYKKAESDFKTAYDLNPYNRNVVNDLASSYAFTKNTALAKKYYEETARISPRFDDPKLNLAVLSIQEKDYKTADKWLKSLYHDSERRTNYQRIVDMNLQK